MTEIIDPLINYVTTLNGPSSVIVFLVMLGYVLKMLPWFPNKHIPLSNFIVGPVLTLFLVDWPSPETMPPAVRFPETAAWLTAIQRGFLLACVAWISHAKILRGLIDDKVPALNPDKITDTTVFKEERTGGGATATTEQTVTSTTETKT